MVEAKLDCLVTAPAGGDRQPDSPYLTGGNPGAGRVSCVMAPGGPAIAVSERADPVDDGWATPVGARARGLVLAIAEQVRSAAPRPRRIGVTGVSGLPGAPDGTMSAGVVAALEGAFPDAEVVDVTGEMQRIRAVKSREEVALIEFGAALLARTVDRAAEVARPGATDLAVWGAMVAELVRGGSEPPSSSRWGSGLRPLTLDRPPHAELQRGSILVLEPEANVAGYRVRATRLLALEACDAVFRDLCAVQAEYWHACFELLAPGRPMADLFAESAAIVKRLAAQPGRYEKIQGTVALAGCGLGLDAPTLASTLAAADSADQLITPGWVFELRAPIGLDIGPRVLTASWSDVVVIEDDGARRLGSHAPGLVTTP
jgi:Xaa-Pro aminopeptidase